MKDFLRRFYSAPRLGRALFITGVILYALDLLLWVPLGDAAIIFFAPAGLLLWAGLIVGTVNMISKSRHQKNAQSAVDESGLQSSAVTEAKELIGTQPSSSSASQAETGRNLMIGGAIFAFLPIPLSKLFPAPDNGSALAAANSGAFAWALMVTIPIGFCVVLGGLVMKNKGSKKQN